MTNKVRLLAMLVSIAVNAAALAAAHEAMTQFTKREQLALGTAGTQSGPSQSGGSAVLATRNCPPSGV